ncbi:MAG: hypothetical protein KTR26_21930 [Flammeovirgaceae bacterium]|nr:hypothetical protein [Flammeovirgaceae bacterium]
MKKFALFFLLIFVNLSAFSQIDPDAFGYYKDALRFSRTTFMGSARFQGMAGAGTAIGGDITNSIQNPAGLGFYRKSEVSFTPAMGFNNSSSKYLSETTKDSRFTLNLNNFGIVISKAKNGDNQDYGGSFGFTVNRIQDFNSTISYEGVNNRNQLVDFFIERATGIDWQVFDNQGIDGAFNTLGLAYFTYLINPDIFEDPGTNNTYLTYVDDPVQFPTIQKGSITTKGAQFEWDFSYGGNIGDRFYYGLGLGLQTVNYESIGEYTETKDGAPNFTELVYIDRLSQSGLGANFKGGIIYRITDRIRVGLSGVTATSIRITESFSEEMTSKHNSIRIIDGFNPDGSPIEKILTDETKEALYADLIYNLKTPARYNGGISYFFGKKGFISADVEYVGYQNSSLKKPRYADDGTDAGFDFSGDNRTISNLYKGTLNLRIGGEIRLNSNRIRAGYANYGDPYSSGNGPIGGKQSITIGCGLRKNNMFFDFGLVSELFETTTSPYVLDNEQEPIVVTNHNKIRALFSLGFFY